jgi:vancomycin permeability regulator SanA
MRAKMIFKLIIKICTALMLIIIISILGVFGVNYYVAKTGEGYIKTIENTNNADCIIVLGAGVFRNTVSVTLAKRLDMAIEVYKSGKSKKIIVSGDHGTKEYNEVGVMRDYLISKGIPKESIFMDHAGFNTYDTIYRAKDVFLVKSAIVVTQREHLLRTLYIAKKIGLPCVGVESLNYDEYEIKFQKPREFLARVKAFLQCEILHSKPGVLGEAIPISGSGILTDDKLKK